MGRCIATHIDRLVLCTDFYWYWSTVGVAVALVQKEMERDLYSNLRGVAVCAAVEPILCGLALDDAVAKVGYGSREHGR